MDRVLVLGGSGFVGRELRDHFGGPAISGSPREGYLPVDATDLNDLRAKVTAARPEVLINCVGLADVDRAEGEPALADSLNRGVVENLVRLQPEVGSRLVQISTDYVFDGEKGSTGRRTPSARSTSTVGRSCAAKRWRYVPREPSPSGYRPPTGTDSGRGSPSSFGTPRMRSGPGVP